MSSELTIIEVALNLPLRRVFDYLPPETTEALLPGSRVIVPFGSRLMSGIVVGHKAQSALPPERLKRVQRATEGGALFSEELLELTRWVAAYYFCGWGEVLEAALPSGMGVRIEVEYQVKSPPLPPEKLEPVSPALQPLLTGPESWNLARWKRQGATPEDLRWLERESRPSGLIALQHRFAGTRSREATEKWLRLKGESPPPPRERRNPKKETRREIVLRLLREEGECPVASLKTVISTPSQVIKTLEAEGLVETFERKVEPRFSLPEQTEPFLALNDGQQVAFEAIHGALREGEYRGFLLQGVTGSGKTEIYLHAVRETLAMGKSCLVLVPEIALTESIVNRFRSRFGALVAVLHSGMGEQERFEEWRRVHQGLATIVIGARSAVFAPLKNPGLIVVDEEHDSSYKQDETPRYHGRDTAIMRAHRAGAVVVLGSATPSLESLRNVEERKLTLLSLPTRVESRPMPEVSLLDMRREPRQKGSPLFSLRLVDALRAVLSRGEQAMIFLNRRGFAHLVRCGACEEPLVCDHCSITLTYHQVENRLRCHRCGFTRLYPKSCPACTLPEIEVIGLGTERIEQDLAIMFPEARILRMDSDTLRRKGELERMLEGIRRRDYDFIIGTQILSKGHDFPHITLVGAVLADVSLNLPDFRSAERTFQILTQMAGRAGRGDLAGEVMIQTYNPGHYSLTHVRDHDVNRFAGEEFAIRKATFTAPFSRHALIWISSPDPGRAESLAREIASRLERSRGEQVRMLGAAEGPIRKIASRFRWMIELRAETIQPIQRLLSTVLDDPSLRPGGKERVVVDIDPYNVM